MITLPKEDVFQIPFLQNDFVGFKEALAFKESQGKYRVVNTLGYLGKISVWSNNIRAISYLQHRTIFKEP